MMPVDKEGRAVMLSRAYSSTVEQYIKCIFLIGQERNELVPMRAIIEEMAVAPSTATAMMRQLQEAGLIRYIKRYGVELTAEGRLVALSMLRRHRLIETFLAEVLQYDWSEVHADAERLEHAVSEIFIDKIEEYMSHPTTDPHGSPIPAKDGRLPVLAHIPLTHADIGTTYQIQRIASDSVGAAREFDNNALRLGMRVRVVERSAPLDVIKIELVGQKRVISMGLRIAELILLQE